MKKTLQNPVPTPAKIQLQMTPKATIKISLKKAIKMTMTMKMTMKMATKKTLPIPMKNNKPIQPQAEEMDKPHQAQEMGQSQQEREREATIDYRYD